MLVRMTWSPYTGVPLPMLSGQAWPAGQPQYSSSAGLFREAQLTEDNPFPSDLSGELERPDSLSTPYLTLRCYLGLKFWASSDGQAHLA